jgi:gliding-associated putative ABC transporter substrate-binding component GldG
MKKKKSVYITITLILGIIVLVNVLANRFFHRFDLTEDNRYTLSEATRNILKTLNQPVTVKAYFSENLPPDVAHLRREFRDLLTEYRSISDGMLAFEFINPNENEATENEATSSGIMPLQINVREKDQIKVQRAFLGAVVQMGEEEDVIPVMQETEGMEYALSTSIKKLSVIDKPLIGVLQGHGEPGLNLLQQALHSLDILYQVEPVELNDTVDMLEKYSTVAVIAPTDSFPESHLQQLTNHLAKGRSLLIAMNRVDADLNQGRGTVVNTNLDTWLVDMGVTVNPNFVYDETCMPIGVQMQQGPFMVTQQVQLPYFPVIVNFPEHLVNTGLEQVVFQFVSSVQFTGDSAVSFTPLAQTSNSAGISPAPTFINIMKEWSESDFGMAKVTIAGAVEGPLAGTNQAKMVVFGDGDFAINRNQQQQGQLNPDNVSLLVNAIDWLSDDTGLIELRTKGATARPLDELEEGKRTFLKLFNFLFPIILIIVFGVIRMQYRQNLRTKRMEEGYV